MIHNTKMHLAKRIAHLQNELNNIEETFNAFLAEQPQFGSQTAYEVRMIAEGYVQQVRDQLDKLMYIVATKEPART